MSITKEQIFQEAILLSPMDKAQLVELILSSFNNRNREEIDIAWSEETEERIAAYKNGLIDSIPMEQVFNHINQK